MTISSLLRIRSIFCVLHLRVFWPFVQRDLCANQIKPVRHLIGESSKKSLLCFSIFVKISPHKRFSYTKPCFELTFLIYSLYLDVRLCILSLYLQERLVLSTSTEHRNSFCSLKIPQLLSIHFVTSLTSHINWDKHFLCKVSALPRLSQQQSNLSSRNITLQIRREQYNQEVGYPNILLKSRNMASVQILVYTCN